MTSAQDVIDGVFIDRSKQNEPVSADAILAALADAGFTPPMPTADGWRTVKLEQPSIDGGQGHGNIDVPWITKSGALIQSRRGHPPLAIYVTPLYVITEETTP